MVVKAYGNSYFTISPIYLLLITVITVLIEMKTVSLLCLTKKFMVRLFKCFFSRCGTQNPLSFCESQSSSPRLTNPSSLILIISSFYFKRNLCTAAVSNIYQLL